MKHWPRNRWSKVHRGAIHGWAPKSKYKSDNIEGGARIDEHCSYQASAMGMRPAFVRERFFSRAP